MPEPVYWIALNLLPAPLGQVRGLHKALRGSLEALRELTPGRLRDLCSRAAIGEGVSDVSPDRQEGGSSTAPPGDPMPRAGGTWWDRVYAGALGYASPLCGPLAAGEVSGRQLVDEAYTEVQRAGRNGVTIATLGEAGYPPLLCCCSAPPPVLYFQGEGHSAGAGAADRDGGAASWWWSDETTRGSPLEPGEGQIGLAVVGSRLPSEYGRLASRRLGRAIATAGAILVSGLARGVDAEAHAGSLEAGGRTWAVLAGGLASDSVPKPNRTLARRIVRQGALVSEFPLSAPVGPGHFPRRNRIIAGLSVATVVVEAAVRSGALITARLALEEGRDVFAVPGRWTDPTAAGSNGLLRHGVAGALSREEDLFEDLSPVWRDRLHPPQGGTRPAALPEGLTEEEKDVLVLLRPDEPSGVDAVIRKAGRPPAAVLAALSSLEIRELIVAVPGGSYLRRT